MRRDVVPAPTDILCETCGYLLNGLPDTGNCPECGAPVADSTIASPRRLPDWEAGVGPPARRFQNTLFSVLWSPGQFFHTLSIHSDLKLAQRFGFLTLLPTIVFNSKTVILHYLILWHTGMAPDNFQSIWVLAAIPFLVVPIWMALYAAIIYLTTVESRYWGMRLPDSVIRRTLPYVGPHATLASLLPLAVVSIYGAGLFMIDSLAEYFISYLLTLSAVVVFAAIYLFSVYWRAMRAMMYANR